VLLLARVLVAAAGVVLVGVVLGSAVRTIVLPRAVQSRIARTVFVLVRAALGLRLGRAPSFARRDHVFASLGPLYLLALVTTWLGLVWAGFAGVVWAIDQEAAGRVFVGSLSSLTTLGFERPPGTLAELAAGMEAIVGLALLALLISYLPTVYASFSRREAAVGKLSLRAGVPPSGTQLLAWTWRFDRFEDLTQVWRSWEEWFTELSETHTSFPVLSYFRSPFPGQSWLTAAGAVLDGASLRCAAFDGPRDIDAELCIRAGYVALRAVASTQGIPYDPHPLPDAPITLVREEVDDVLDLFAEVGMPLRQDRDQVWRDFSGWRVNYDQVLVSLATSIMAPFAPWSSDRSVRRFRKPPLRPPRLGRPAGPDDLWGWGVDEPEREPPGETDRGGERPGHGV